MTRAEDYLEQLEKLGLDPSSRAMRAEAFTRECVATIKMLEQRLADERARAIEFVAALQAITAEARKSPTSFPWAGKIEDAAAQYAKGWGTRKRK